MKEVKKCSISGVAFTMDADAYEALETYLESLKTTYKDTADGRKVSVKASETGDEASVTIRRETDAADSAKTTRGSAARSR